MPENTEEKRAPGLFMIGQRVIVRHEIAVIVAINFNADRITVRFIDGCETWYSAYNVEPLPNGQL